MNHHGTNTCEHCKFADDHGHIGGQLWCHEAPPNAQVLQIMSINALGRPETKSQVVSAWPPVKPDDWCNRHEFKLKVLS